jgi:spermidine synthase
MPGISQGKFAANLQKIVSYRREESGLYREIAKPMALKTGERVLVIGTGTGLQLRAVHQIQPTTEL